MVLVLLNWLFVQGPRYCLHESQQLLRHMAGAKETISVAYSRESNAYACGGSR